MKNKKFTIGAALLMAGSLLLTNCVGDKTNKEISPDYEKTSTKDVSKLNWIAADIFDICMETCDKGQLSAIHNYSTSGSVVVTVNSNTVTHIAAGAPTILGQVYTIVFNNTVGKDGHLRNGTLTFDYSFSTIPVTEPKQPKWYAKVTATNFSIDSYSITLSNNFMILTTTPFGYPAPPFTPSVTPMTWNESGSFTAINSTGTGSAVVTHTNDWTGSLDIKLLNTYNQAVPTPSGNITFTINVNPNGNTSPLQWEKAHLSYSGTFSGNLEGIGSYGGSLTGVTRNLNTAPETFYKHPSNNMLVSAEKHPFLSGTMTFKPGNKPTRDIDYGVSTVVDYNAKMTIQGITYDVDCAEINN
jgi:hypothetical protein